MSCRPTSLVAWALFAVCAAVAGCSMSRFPTCKNDGECAAHGDGKKLCYDLRCVACRSDEDCSAGSTCTVSKECKALGGEGFSPAASGDAPPADAGAD